MSNFMSSREERRIYRKGAGRRNARSFSFDSQKRTTSKREVKGMERFRLWFPQLVKILANDDKQLIHMRDIDRADKSKRLRVCLS